MSGAFLPIDAMMLCDMANGPDIVMLPDETGPAAIHRTEVTRADYAAFVEATGYRTLAEREDPDSPDDALGSAVFQSPTARSPSWWHLDRTANWRNPAGSAETAEPIDPREPVVHIALEDATAYADWIGGRLPTLLEWRRAALAGQAWDHITAPSDQANTWQGAFPLSNGMADGYAGLAPVGTYPENAYGLYDMVGNAWEWTATKAGPRHGLLAGGSFLCDVDFCRNGTPFGEQVQEIDFSASHIGFRLVFDERPEACDA